MSSPADQPAPGLSRNPTVAARVEQLYANHVALVRSVCRSLLRDRSEAEDAVQQTFLSAQRALLNGSSPRDAAAWLATIARHECLARVRARMREPLPVEIEEHEAPAPDAHVAAVHRHEAGELRDALAELPAQQREAILLRELRGLSYQEVAASLAVTTSAVESLLFRARRSLKVRLQEALAALTPVAWIQDLASRLAGGVTGPAAAKVAAVGLGTAVATSGALVAPTVIGLGHAPAPRISAPPAPRHRPAASTASNPSNPTVWATAAPRPTRLIAVSRPEAGDRGGGGDSGSRTEISDRQSSSDTRERESSSSTTSSTTGDGSGSTHETGDSKTTSGGTGASTDSASTDSASTDSASTNSASTDSTPSPTAPDSSTGD